MTIAFGFSSTVVGAIGVFVFFDQKFAPFIVLGLFILLAHGVLSALTEWLDAKNAKDETYNVEDNRPGWEDEETRRRQVAKYGYSSGYRPKPTKGDEQPPPKKP